MLNLILNYCLDFVAFGAVVLTATVGTDVWLRRSGVAGGIGRRAWVLVAVLLVGGTAIGYFSGEKERDQLKQTLLGFAPTYADELARLGHADVHLDTRADDPVYLKLINAEKRWLRVNPAVNDIYTFRHTPDGKIAFIVDSETDYDHNGVFEGEREERTPIGEIYDEPTPEFEAALHGEGAFEGDVTTDRWGTWVTATCPIFGPDGKVEAAVGVDFDAHTWVRSILFRRAGLLGFTAVAIAILLGSCGVISLAKSEIGRRREAEKSARRAESRLQTILDHEPEGVIICSTDGTIRQLNPSGVALLEVEGGTEKDRSLISFIEPQDQTRASDWIKSIAAGQAGRRTMRIVGQRSGEKWIDAHAVPMRWNNEPAVEVLIVARDVTAARAAEAEREKLQSQLVTASRQAGMADIATGILHNVGNVLNTINVSAHVLTDKLRQSRVPSVGRAADLLIEQRAQLPTFLTTDDRGKQFPDYLGKLATCLRSEHEEMLGTLRGMAEGLDHLKAIVHSQQSFAGNVRVEEALRPAAVFDEALKLNVASFERHHVNVKREFGDVPLATLDKHKTLQILINLISNAKNAVKSATDSEGVITLRLGEGNTNGQRTVKFIVSDNGVGIAPEHLTRIFAMGFTTRKEGHGFGLHSAANLAKEMGGTLTVDSAGTGQGATFTLELPAAGREVLA